MIILLAEDLQVLRREIERAFSDIPGVEKVVLASSAAETRDVAKGEPCDLVVLEPFEDIASMTGGSAC